MTRDDRKKLEAYARVVGAARDLLYRRNLDGSLTTTPAQAEPLARALAHFDAVFAASDVKRYGPRAAAAMNEPAAPASRSVGEGAPWYLADGSTVMLPLGEVERRRKAAAKVLALCRRFVREDEEAPGDLRWGHHVAEDGTDLGMHTDTFALEVDRLLCEIERAPEPASAPHVCGEGGKGEPRVTGGRDG